MTNSAQILTCPKCQAEHSVDQASVDASYTPLGAEKPSIPERYVIEACSGCGVPFYTVKKHEDVEVHRVSGGWVCHCGKEARNHPHADGMPTEGGFVRLCDGRVGKL